MKLALIGTLLLGLIAIPVQSISAQSQSGHSQEIMLEQTKKIADSYIKFQNDHYVIKEKKELLAKVGQAQMKAVEEQVNFTNQQMASMDLSNATVNGNTVHVNVEFTTTSNGIQPLAKKEGKDDIKFHWTYAEVWISKSTSEKIVKVGAGALGTALGGIGGKLANAIAGSIVGGSISEFFAGSVAKAIYFKISLLPPFLTWDIREQ